jgi:hypothetical protein
MRADPSTRALAYVPLHPARKIAKAEHVDDVVGAAGAAARCSTDAALRARSTAALAKVRALREQWQGRLQASAAMEALVPAGTSAVDLATVLTTVRFTVPVVVALDSIELNLPAVLGAPALSYARLLASSRADFADVERALATCAVAEPSR